MKQAKKSISQPKTKASNIPPSITASTDGSQRHSEIIQDMERAFTAANADMIADWIKLSQDAMECATYKDILNWQAKALGMGIQSCVETGNKLYNITTERTRQAFIPFLSLPYSNTSWMLGL